ncbi:MAG: gluconate 2-dehydrogenase subunit 3 family protein [Vicinamibacteraceae bacterium]
MTTRTLLSRRRALKTLAAGAGGFTFLPWLSDEGLAVFVEIQSAKALPRLKAMTAAQYATTEALVEAIIPTDERSPGAKEARVADYLDLLLSEARPPLKQEWLDGLAALEAEATSRFGTPFLRLEAAQAEALLTDISAYEWAKPKPAAPNAAVDLSRNEQPKETPRFMEDIFGEVSIVDPAAQRPPLEAFFALTKEATIRGYYTSEIGIHKELRYKGNKFLVEFVGCQTQDKKDCPYCGQKAKGSHAG